MQVPALKGQNLVCCRASFHLWFQDPVIWPLVHFFKVTDPSDSSFLFSISFFCFLPYGEVCVPSMNVYWPRQGEVVSVLFLCVTHDEAGSTRRVTGQGLWLEGAQGESS